jgi:hypothetical protein
LAFFSFLSFFFFFFFGDKVSLYSPCWWLTLELLASSSQEAGIVEVLPHPESLAILMWSPKCCCVSKQMKWSQLDKSYTLIFSNHIQTCSTYSGTFKFA